jgi:hypothetical protein
MMSLKSIARHPSSVAYRTCLLRVQQTQVQATWSTHRFRCLNIAAGDPVPRKRKVWDSVDEAVDDVKSGDTLLSGGLSVWTAQMPTGVASSSLLCLGFGLCGTPDTLIGALARRKEVKNLTAVSNNAGSGEYGLGRSDPTSALSSTVD